jgi:hypothetical protein
MSMYTAQAGASAGFPFHRGRKSGGFKYHAIILLAVQLYYPSCKSVCCCLMDRSDSVRQEHGLSLGRRLPGN